MGLRNWDKEAKKLHGKGISPEPVITVMRVENLTEEELYRLKERSAIMEHDGGLSSDQADKYAWCREVCMLTPGHGTECPKKH